MEGKKYNKQPVLFYRCFSLSLLFFQQFLGKNNLLPACEEGSDRAKELRAFRRSCIEKIRRYVKDGIGDIRMSVMESKTEVVDVRVKEELEPVFEADPLWISEPDSKDVKTEHEEYDGTGGKKLFTFVPYAIS